MADRQQSPYPKVPSSPEQIKPPTPGTTLPERSRPLAPRPGIPIENPLAPIPLDTINRPSPNSGGEYASPPMPSSFEQGRQQEQQHTQEPGAPLKQPLSPQIPR